MSGITEVRGIIHHYDLGDRRQRDSPLPALDGVDLRVESGALCALIGANGSGKTTLLRILAGVLQPSSGTVHILGIESSAGRGDRERRRRSSYISQDPALDPEMTAGETLHLLAALHGVRRTERARRVAEVAAAFGLEDRLGSRIDALSGGLRRRLHLAAGSIHEPELLLLDEPSAGLDPQGSDTLWAELGRRRDRGLTTVIVSHALAAVEEHATAVAILERGKLIAVGAPRALAQVGPNGSKPIEASSLAEAYRQLTGRALSALEPLASDKSKKSGRRRRGR